MGSTSTVKTIRVNLKSTMKQRKLQGGGDKDESPPEELSMPEIPLLPIEPPPEVALPSAGSKHRTFPKGILRKTARRKPTAPKATDDPTQSRKKTMRILTGNGQKKVRMTLRRQVKRMDDKTIRQKLVDRKLISSGSKANAGLLRKMYEEAVGAGLMKI